MLTAQPGRILVVDDIIDNLILFETLLEEEGYEVDTANNGYLALEKIENSPPDLLLLDIMMPGIDGYGVTEQIRQNKELSLIPILFVTAYKEAESVVGLNTKLNDFICKPIDCDELVAKIKALMVNSPEEAIAA